MIRVSNLQGTEHYTTPGNIKYITVWNTKMATKGGIRLYNGNLDLVADFGLGEADDEIVAYIYPHNHKFQLTTVAGKLEPEIRKAITDVLLKSARKSVTLDLADNKVKVVDKQDFSRFSSLAAAEDELFLFESIFPNEGFPQLYLHEKFQRTSATYGDVFGNLVRMSRVVFPALHDAPTSDGIKFTYMLMNSFRQSQFDDNVPAFAGVCIPTKENCAIPPGLPLKVLEDFLVECGIDNMTMAEIEGTAVEFTPEDDTDIDDADMPMFLLTDEDIQQTNTNADDEVLARVLFKQIEEKGMFNLGDAFTLGLEKVMAMVPISNKIIEGNVNFTGIVSKICIHKGMFYVIPLIDQKDRLCDVLDVDETLIRVCTAETYPRTGLLSSS